MKSLLTQKPIYLYIAIFGFMSGMIVALIPIMQLMGEHGKTIEFINPIIKSWRLYFICLIIFICGFTTAFASLKFFTWTYWTLDKPEPKCILKIVK